MKVQAWSHSKQRFLSIFSCLYKLIQCWPLCNFCRVTESWKGTGRLCLCWLQHLQKTFLRLETWRQGSPSPFSTVSPNLVWIFWCAVSGVLLHIPSSCVSVVLTASPYNVFLCRGCRSKSQHAPTLPERGRGKGRRMNHKLLSGNFDYF